MGFVWVLTLKIKSLYAYPLKSEVKSKIHPEAKFLEPWTFLCFLALFGPFLAQKSPNQIVCIILHLDLWPRWHPSKKKKLKNNNIPMGGSLLRPPWPPQGPCGWNFFTALSFCPYAEHDFKKKLGLSSYTKWIVLSSVKWVTFIWGNCCNYCQVCFN